MLSRSNLVLIALLLIQLAALAIGLLTAAGTESRPVESIVPGMDADAVTRLTIADEAGDQLVFARVADGWALPEADDFPVLGDKVDEVLGKLLALDTRRLVASNPSNFARLEVKDDDFRRLVTLETDAASTTLYLGGSGGVDTVYTRRAGEDRVYLGFGLSSWELSTQAPTWVDTSYVNIVPDDVLEITVSNAEGSFTFARDGENWTYAGLPEGEIFEDTKMPGILRNAATVRLMAPLGKEQLDEYGLDAPQVTVDLRYRVLVASEGGDDESADEDATEPALSYVEESYQLAFGAESEDGVVIKASTADYYVLARDTVLSAFSGLTHDDFIRRAEPEVEAEAAANP